MSRLPASRRLLGVVVLLALVTTVAALPLVGRITTFAVALVVDGSRHQVETDATTVAGVIESEGIELAAGDAVLPAPDSQVEAGTVIRVLRSIDVELVVDGDATPVRGTFRTVAGALAEAGVTLADGQLVTPDVRTRVDDGATITVTSPRTVTVVADDVERTTSTHLATLGELLELRGVAVGAVDRLVVVAEGETPARVEADEPLVDGMRYEVRRVTSSEEVEEVVLEHDEETRETDELFEGESRVVQEGEDGLERRTFALTWIEDRLAEREQVDVEVVAEPVTRIVEQGTRERPPPPPPPPPAPTRAPEPARSTADPVGPVPTGEDVWLRLASCESGQRWSYDGRFDGGLQFHPDTWTAYKPAGAPQYAWQASAAVQIEAGKRLQAARGWGQWPSCASKLGLR